jgi:hypothetical protein
MAVSIGSFVSLDMETPVSIIVPSYIPIAYKRGKNFVVENKRSKKYETDSNKLQ